MGWGVGGGGSWAVNHVVCPRYASHHHQVSCTLQTLNKFLDLQVHLGGFIVPPDLLISKERLMIYLFKTIL